MQSAETELDIIRTHGAWMQATAPVRTGSLESRVPGNWHALFGKGPTEKARHMAGPRRRPTSLDEGRLETESGLGSAEPAMHCVDSARPIDYRASLLLYLHPSRSQVTGDVDQRSLPM